MQFEDCVMMSGTKIFSELLEYILAQTFTTASCTVIDTLNRFHPRHSCIGRSYIASHLHYNSEFQPRGISPKIMIVSSHHVSAFHSHPSAAL